MPDIITSKSIFVLVVLGMLTGCSGYRPPEPSPDTGSISDTTEEQNRVEAERQQAEEAIRQAETEQRRAETARREAEEARLSAKRETILADLSRLDQRHSTLSSKVSEKEDFVSDLRNQLTATESEINTFKGQVQSYISDNIAAASCIGAADVALSEGNQYEQDVQEMAQVTTVICGAGFLFYKPFRDQVINVADQLNQADIRTNNLKQQASNLQSEISERLAALELDENALQEVDRKIQARQYELEELDDL